MKSPKTKFIKQTALITTSLFLITASAPALLTSCAQAPVDPEQPWPFATNIAKTVFNWNLLPYLQATINYQTNQNQAVSIPLGWFAQLVANVAKLPSEAINANWLSSWFQVNQEVKIDTAYLNRVFNQDRALYKDLFNYFFTTWFSPLLRLDNHQPYQSLVNGQLQAITQFDWIEFRQDGSDLKMYCYIIDQTGQQTLVPFWTYPAQNDNLVNTSDHFRFNLKIPIGLAAVNSNAVSAQQVVIKKTLNYQDNGQVSIKQLVPIDNKDLSFTNLKNHLLAQNIQSDSHPNLKVVLTYLSGTTYEQLLPLNLIETWLERRRFNSLNKPIQYLINDYSNISIEIPNSDLFTTINGWSKMNKKEPISHDKTLI